MALLFCHGLESGPIGRKSQALIEAGYEVIAPDGRGRDLAARIAGLLEVLDGLPSPPVLVGSSSRTMVGMATFSELTLATINTRHRHWIASISWRRGCPSVVAPGEGLVVSEVTGPS